MKTRIKLFMILITLFVSANITSFGQTVSTAPTEVTSFTEAQELPDNSAQLNNLKEQITNFVPSYSTSELNELHLALLKAQLQYESGLTSGQLTQQEINDLQQAVTNLQSKITGYDQQLILIQAQQNNRQHVNDKQWIQNNAPPAALPAPRGPGLYPDNSESIPATNPK